MHMLLEAGLIYAYILTYSICVLKRLHIHTYSCVHENYSPGLIFKDVSQQIRTFQVNKCAYLVINTHCFTFNKKSQLFS